MPAETKWRILVVDDDQPLLTLLVETLNIEFDVVPAINGLDALEKIDRSEPDLIILDVAMPCVDGVDTCRAIRKNARFSRVPVLFLSGQDQFEYIERARDLGVHRFLQKPMAPVDLLACCRELIRDGGLGAPSPKSLSLDELHRSFAEPHGQPSAPPVLTGPQSEAETRERVAVPAGEPPPQTPDDAVRSDTDTTPSWAGEPGVALAIPGKPPPRIMLIDDDPDVIAFMLSILRNLAEVFGVTEPISAIDKIVRFQPDLIVLDVAMPHISGYQISQLLRLNRNLRAIKVLFASAVDDPRKIDYAMKLGAAGYLVKPFTPNQLVESLAGIVREPDFIVRAKEIPFEEIVAAQKRDKSDSIFV